MSNADIIEWKPAEVEQVSSILDAADPAAFQAKVAEVAKSLVSVIEDRKLYTLISGRKHIRVEGWTYLATMCSLFAYVVWSREIEDSGDGGGWEARVEVRTRDGQTIGAAEASCMRSEKQWANRDDYALRSMAQTRAVSKALKMPLGFVFQVAGYETTPAEEMTADSSPPPRPANDPTLVEERQTAEIFRLLEELFALDPATDWAAWCREYAGVPFNKIDKIGADRVIVGLMEKVHNLSPPSEAE